MSIDRRLFTVIAAFLLLPSYVLAEIENQVRIEGVRFYCDGCLVLDDTQCAIPQASNSLIVPCNKVFDYLLKANTKMKLELPTSKELIGYLVKQSPEEVRVSSILKTIAERHDYQLLTTYSMAALIRKYPRTMEQVLANGWGNQMAISRIWGLLIGTNDLELLGTKGIVLGRLDNVSVEDIVRELPNQTDTDLVSTLLSVATTYANAYKRPQYSALHSLNRLIQSCLDERASEIHICDLSQLDNSLSAVREYIRPIYVDYIVKQLEIKSLSLDKKSELLGSIPLELLQISDIENIASIAVPLFLNSSEPVSRNQLEQSRLTDLMALSGMNQDSLIGRVQLLLSKVEKREQKLAQEALDPDGPQSTSRVISATLPASKTTLSMLVLRLAFGALMIGISVIVFRNWREHGSKLEEFAKKSDKHFEEDRQRQAMDEVFEFFGLPANAEEEDVRKAYRQLAREHHPDMAEADTEKFLEIQANYEKAQKLFGNG